MTYQHIKISAIPAPLGEVIDAQSATSKAIAAEMALIHAAPELLAALKAMIEYDTGTPDDVLNQARAAIAKAEGK